MWNEGLVVTQGPFPSFTRKPRPWVRYLQLSSTCLEHSIVAMCAAVFDPAPFPSGSVLLVYSSKVSIISDQHIRGSPSPLAVNLPIEELGTPILIIGVVRGSQLGDYREERWW